jgi:hypothetical protein
MKHQPSSLASPRSFWLATNALLVACSAPDPSLAIPDNGPTPDGAKSNTNDEDDSDHFHRTPPLELTGEDITLPSEVASDASFDFMVLVDSNGIVHRKYLEVSSEQRAFGAALDLDFAELVKEHGGAPDREVLETWRAQVGLPSIETVGSEMRKLIDIPEEVLLLQDLNPQLERPDVDIRSASVITDIGVHPAYDFDYYSGYWNTWPGGPCHSLSGVENAVRIYNAINFGAQSEGAKVLCYYNIETTGSDTAIHFTYPNYWTAGSSFKSYIGILFATRDMNTVTSHGAEWLAGDFAESDTRNAPDFDGDPRVCIMPLSW